MKNTWWIKNAWIIRVFIFFLILFTINSILFYLVVNGFFDEMALSSSWFYAVFNILYLILALFINKRKRFIEAIPLKKHYLWLFLLFLTLYLSEFFVSVFKFYTDKPLNYDTEFLIYILVTLSVVPIFEEIFFRKIFLDPFILKRKVILGLFITSIFFSIIHYPFLYNFSFLKAFDLFIFGFTLGLIRLFFGLRYAIIGHAFRDLLSLLYNYHIINLFVIEYLENYNVFKFFYYLNYFLVLGIILMFIYKIHKKFS